MTITYTPTPLTHHLEFDEYRQLDALNASLLKTVFAKGIDYGRALYHGQITEAGSPALKIGTEIHARVLEDTTAHVVAPDGLNPRTKAYKEWETAQTLPVLTPAQADTVSRVCDAVLSDRQAALMLDMARGREVTVTRMWDKVPTGARLVPLKARLDACTADQSLIVDLKTTSSFDDFTHSFFKFGYDIQADFYQLVAGCESFVFIVVETAAPYRVMVTEYKPSRERVQELVWPVWEALHAPVLPKLDEVKQIEDSAIPAWVDNVRQEHIADLLDRLPN